MCAVDQKKPFFPRAGPFLDLLPFKGPFSLTGALTGTALREGPLRGGFLREGWALTGSPLQGGTVLTGRAGVPFGSSQRRTTKRLTGRPLTGRLLMAPYALQALLRGGFLWGGTSLQEGPLVTGGSFTGMGPFTEKDDEEAYGKPLTGKDGPCGKGRSLPGSRIGREFPLVCRRPKKVVFS